MSEPVIKIPGGFAKSFRKELQSDVWMMPPIYHRVWYWLRLNVQHEAYLFPTRERFGIWVLPGQKITSHSLIAEGVKWTEWGKEKVPNKRTIKAVLGWLEAQEMVTVESNAKGTLITIVNWHSYNAFGAEKVTAESNEKYPRSAHKLEGIEGKEVKSKPSSPEALRLSGVLADMILKNNPGNTKLNNGKREATVARWAVDIDKLIRIDGKTAGEIERVIHWCQADSFWMTNILSGTKLREKWDQLTVKMQGNGKDKTAESDRYGMFAGVA